MFSQGIYPSTPTVYKYGGNFFSIDNVGRCVKYYLMLIAMGVIIFVGCSDSVNESDPQKQLQMQDADDNQLSDSLKNIFYEDGYRLALKSFLSQDSVNMEIVEIPDSLFQEFYNGLIHIYNSSSAERDSIFDLYCIHSAPEPVFHEFIVVLDSIPDWLERWSHNNVPVGNPLVDSLIQTYSIEIVSYSESNIDNWLY